MAWRGFVAGHHCEYTKDDILYEFIIHNDATADLRVILKMDRPTGLKLLKALDQIRSDQDLMDRLTQSEWGGSPSWPRPKSAWFNTGAWGKAQGINMNLWRLRFFEKEIQGYRLIHAFFPLRNQYQLLAIVEKAEFGAINDVRFDYELSHPIAKRIALAYSALVDRYQ